MTISFTDIEEIPDDVLGFTESLFRLAMVDLQELVNALLEGRGSDAKAAKTAIRDLRQIGNDLVRERANAEALRKQIAGSVGAGAELDLDAARDEIGRRLALLRAARGD